MEKKFDFYNNESIKSYNFSEKIRYQLKMLDGLDAFTRKHCDNVANITCRICENLKMEKGFIVYCTTCAYLHDIGKLFIPQTILQKPGKLSDEEYNIIKTHTSIGYKICMNDPQLRPYAAGALYHHEALDGTGYPNGIVGNKIPYEAQIIRVADEFEAITAKRQYKSHIGIIDALNILVEHARPSNDPNAQKIGTKKVGKIDTTVLKALFKVVIEDTEYEIVVNDEYVEFLKKEIARLKEAEKYYNKMKKQKNEEKYNYYKQCIQYCLKKNEDPEKVPIILKEIQDTFNVKNEHIKKLYDEIKEIKKLKI